MVIYHYIIQFIKFPASCDYQPLTPEIIFRVDTNLSSPTFPSLFSSIRLFHPSYSFYISIIPQKVNYIWSISTFEVIHLSSL